MEIYISLLKSIYFSSWKNSKEEFNEIFHKKFKGKFFDVKSNKKNVLTNESIYKEFLKWEDKFYEFET